MKRTLAWNLLFAFATASVLTVGAIPMADARPQRAQGQAKTSVNRPPPANAQRAQRVNPPQQRANTAKPSNRANAGDKANTGQRANAGNNVKAENRANAGKNVNAENRANAGNNVNAENRANAGKNVNAENRANAGNNVNAENRADTANNLNATNRTGNNVNAGNRTAAGNNVGNRANVNNGNVNRNVNNGNINRNVNVNADGYGHYDDDDDFDNPLAAALVVGATVAVTAAAIGSIMEPDEMPNDCSQVMRNNTTYLQCGSTWYQPQYQGSNVNYVVVPAP
ncbi:hypothetical protein [Pseudomonas sp. C9]|uniref:hypothetical protein n=1 Tax=Pseudomonas sp. C9 TaxID=1311337 RepID=UPI0009843A57|nr:hypothetical protein [Pseudomonas sp. C9]OOG10445.1 hypothetical protein BMS17_28395 [Pseudomonas sp. C9]